MGVFTFHQYRKGKLIARRRFPNTPTVEGLLHVLKVTTDEIPKLPPTLFGDPWFYGLIAAGEDPPSELIFPSSANRHSINPATIF